MRAFLSVFGLVFAAELADKSRLVGLLLISAFQAPLPVFFGMTAGFLLLDGLAVWAGFSLAAHAPGPWIGRLAGGLLCALGAAALALPEASEETALRWLERRRALGAFAVSFVAICGSEFLDRTQLACAALSAQTGRPAVVLGGAMAALTVLNALTVWLGARLSARLRMRPLYRISGLIFLALGLALLLKRA